MQSDVVVLMMSNLLFSIWIAPFVVTLATVIRTALLLTGKRRTFRSWTRNAILSVVTIIFAPGMVINTGVRYAIAALFRIDIEGPPCLEPFGNIFSDSLEEIAEFRRGLPLHYKEGCTECLKYFKGFRKEFEKYKSTKKLRVKID